VLRHAQVVFKKIRQLMRGAVRKSSSHQASSANSHCENVSTYPRFTNEKRPFGYRTDFRPPIVAAPDDAKPEGETAGADRLSDSPRTRTLPRRKASLKFILAFPGSLMHSFDVVMVHWTDNLWQGPCVLSVMRGRCSHTLLEPGSLPSSDQWVHLLRMFRYRGGLAPT
jgi:hypothetical protein